MRRFDRFSSLFILYFFTSLPTEIYMQYGQFQISMAYSIVFYQYWILTYLLFSYWWYSKGRGGVLGFDRKLDESIRFIQLKKLCFIKLKVGLKVEIFSFFVGFFPTSSCHSIRSLPAKKKIIEITIEGANTSFPPYFYRDCFIMIIIYRPSFHIRKK